MDAFWNVFDRLFDWLDEHMGAALAIMFGLLLSFMVLALVFGQACPIGQCAATGMTSSGEGVFMCMPCPVQK